MLPDVTLPASLAGLLVVLRPCFTGPSFRTFCGLVAGLCGRARRRTACGMLLGAGLSRAWPHDRAHYFFARARWDIDELGLAVARLAAGLLVPAGAPLTVAVDDSLFRRRGRRVHGVAWQHDGSAPSAGRMAFGTCFVTCGIIVSLPFCSRPVCLPALARLHVPGPGGRKPRGSAARRQATAGSKTSQAVALVTMLAQAFPGRKIHVVADALYHGPALRELPGSVSWTTRLPKNAVLNGLPAPRTGRPGRPAIRGPRLGTPADLAAAADLAGSWTPSVIAIYGRDQQADLAEITCLWYGCLGGQAVRVILARSRGDGTTLALVTTDLHTPPAAITERYAARWSTEQAYADARNILGAGETRNRTRTAVERTVPFALLTSTLVVLWYATSGYHPADIEHRRNAEPWYTTKTEPAFEDMLAKLRRTLITARISGSSPAQPEPRQITAVLAAWHAAAA